MFVCALVLTVGLAAVMGILYSNFDGQMRKELSKEAAYLAYGVEQQGTDYQKNVKDKSSRILILIRMELYFLIIRLMQMKCKIIRTELNFRKQRNMVQENVPCCSTPYAR